MRKKTLIDKLPKNRGELLAFMIKLTERAISNPKYDEFFIKQAERLKKELREWKKANST